MIKALTSQELAAILQDYRVAFDMIDLNVALNETFLKYNINTKLRQCHYLAQTCYETGGYKYKRENFNYSAKSLRAVFPSKFKNIEQAKEYQRQPEKIANYVYGGRYGNVHPKDGWKFRGGGSIMLTFYEGYKQFSNDIQEDLCSNAELIEQLPYFSFAGGFFWKNRNINYWADKNDIEKVTKLINPALHGLQHRKDWFNKIKKILT